MSEKVRLSPVSGYVYGLCLAAVTVLASWVVLLGVPARLDVALACLVLTAACAVSFRFPAVVFGRGTALMVDAAYLTALVLLGPVWAVIVASPSFLYRDRLRTSFVASYHTLALLGAGYVFGLFSEPLLFSGTFGNGFVYGTLLACATFYSLEAAANSVLARLKYGDPLLHTLQETYLPLLGADAVVVAATFGVSLSLSVFGPVAPLALFSGMAAGFGLLHLAQERRGELRALKEENGALKREYGRLEESFFSSHLEFALRLVEKLGRRDGYTAHNAAASAVYAADLAREFRLEPAKTEKLQLAALLRDIGLVGAPDEVLLTSPGKLNSVGRMLMEEHPANGENVLAGVPGFEEAARWVRWHHEKMDGTGYPDRLRGEWIPLEARILAVAGFYASRILDGPHSPALGPQQARRELVGASGKALDDGVVRALLRVLDSEDDNYATASDDRFAFPAALPQRGFSPGSVTPLRPTGTTETR